jgi:hypothetical protein
MQVKMKRVQERKRLVRALKRNPRVATRSWFLRKAALFGLDLPIAIRLSPAINQAGDPDIADVDQIELQLGTDPTAAPVPVGVAAGDVQSTIDGSVTGALRFSQDPAGYGQLGTVELGFGSVQMTGTGFDLVHDAAPGGCGDPALLRSVGPIQITSGGTGSQGFVNFFTGSFSMSVHTSFQFASETRTVCTDPYVTTALMDGAGRPPLPIRLDGAFRVSPAITADGRVRLGKLAITGVQADSFVKVHSCVTAPPPATCALGTDGVMNGRLVATAFNAELLIGATL